MAGSVSRSTEATEVFLLFNRRCHFSVQDTQAGLLERMAIATENVAPRVRLALGRFLRYFKKREARPQTLVPVLGLLGLRMLG
jgi:hypothetical protein